MFAFLMNYLCHFIDEYLKNGLFGGSFAYRPLLRIAVSMKLPFVKIPFSAFSKNVNKLHYLKY